MDLGFRMKQYEAVSKAFLPRRMPCIIRINGKAFHTFTRGMKKPWDPMLVGLMLSTARFLCREVHGVKLAYWQSDEISLLLTDYDAFRTESWFDKNIQKMVSVAASIATAKFNQIIHNIMPNLPLAFFGARAFILPREEVVNYFIWRQQDAINNSIQSLAQVHFNHKDLHGLSQSELQDKLMAEKGINWNNCKVWQKRGAAVIKNTYTKNNAVRSRWVVDLNTPIFTKDRDYIEQYVLL